MDTTSPYIHHAGDRRGWHSVQKPTVEMNDVSFDDVIDALNPLNHLPVISSLNASPEPNNPLREVTKLTGSYLLGGPFGLAFSAASTIYEEAKGQSIIGSVISGAIDFISPEVTAAKYLPAELPKEELDIEA